MDSASSSASSSPAFRSSVFKHPLTTPQQRYKQQQQLLRDQLMADKAAAAAERVRRDRMSRGKDPYCSDEASDDSEQLSRNSPAKFRPGGSAEQEDFGKKERREKAVAFLDSPELLMMYAQSQGDSIAGARLHFMKMMCGYDEESIDEANSYYATNSGSRSARQTRDTDKRRGGDRASGR
ncbi:hypothetical protein CONLIGDRAFT_682412 [Coniochaeta ligniaria NRRL 30616]|uniref:Uncharacterized protein n=1 Tax=Coniochaeta ligniaria NRRL 30616 TaxID=1408157 RepID=A0A1J7IJA1_9PEZI|nr:hypothetical protein CONLIGDRAFT_682412 [Coniochaeta ligniaria NRRL 30616]